MLERFSYGSSLLYPNNRQSKIKSISSEKRLIRLNALERLVSPLKVIAFSRGSGGFPAFVTAHALIQTLLATIESALLSALFIPFAQYPVVQEMTYLIISVGLLLAISFMAAVVGVHVLIRRNNFLAVSFSSVLLITFASAFYPIDSLPTWAATIAAYNPITYLVDIIRAALFGIEPLLVPPLEIGICIAFLVGLIIAAFCVAHCPFDTSNVQNV